MKKLIQPRTAVISIIVVFGGAWRLLVSGVHVPLENFTPIGAMALFGGCYFANKGKALLLPLLALFLSDLIIMQVFYPSLNSGLLYEGWYWTYGAFALIVLLGKIIKKVNIKSVAMAAISAAIVHWVVSDFGVWVGGIDITTGLPFTKDFTELLKCYALAIPYLKNTMMGNLIFSGVMFGAFELAQKQFPVLAKPTLI